MRRCAVVARDNAEHDSVGESSSPVQVLCSPPPLVTAQALFETVCNNSTLATPLHRVCISVDVRHQRLVFQKPLLHRERPFPPKPYRPVLKL